MFFKSVFFVRGRGGSRGVWAGVALGLSGKSSCEDHLEGLAAGGNIFGDFKAFLRLSKAVLIDRIRG